MRLAVSQVSGRRADQLGNFMAVLKLSAINLYHGARIAYQALRCRLHQPRLAGTGRAQEQEVPYRTCRTVHSREIHLIDVYDVIDCLVLAYDPLVQVRVQFFGVLTSLCRIEFLVQPYHIDSPPLRSRAPYTHYRD